jgi:hypothetical protein
VDLCFGICIRALHEVLWIMRDSQKKAALFCVLAFLAGLLVATSGCALGTSTRMGVDQHQYETGAGIYIEKK